LKSSQGEISYHAKDILFKSMSGIYKDQALDVYGLEYPKIKEMLPNEFPQVKADEKRADSIFLLADGSILLLEYESNKRVKENMLKYIEYSIRIIDKYLREEKTFKKVYVAVVYTSNIDRATNSISFGSTNIEVNSVFMGKFNGDEILKDIEYKIVNGIELSSKDKMKLILVPLMKSSKDKHEVIERTIELSKLIEDDYEQCAVIAGILTATDKIIKEEYGIKIREWLKMTKVEKIIEKEKEELAKETEKKKAIEIARNLLDILSIEVVAQKTGLTIEEVKNLKK